MSTPTGGLVLVGAGAMGQALLAGALAAGTDPVRVQVIEALPATAAAVAERYPVDVRTSPPAALPEGSLIVLAVKPQQVTATLAGLAGRWPTAAALLSIAAGIPRSQLAALVPPGVAVLRAMPNTAALVGRAVTGLVCGEEVPGWAQEAARALLAGVGTVVTVEEDQIDALTVLSGSGPAYLFYLAESMIDSGVALGLDRSLATQLTVDTLLGAATLLSRSPDEAVALRAQVTSPGGVTQAVIETFAAAGLPALVQTALARGHARSRELAQDTRH